jgi:hypothetical protein
MLSNSGFNFEKKIQIVIVNNSANINKTNNISQNTKTTPYDIRIVGVVALSVVDRWLNFHLG